MKSQGRSQGNKQTVIQSSFPNELNIHKLTSVFLLPWHLIILFSAHLLSSAFHHTCRVQGQTLVVFPSITMLWAYLGGRFYSTWYWFHHYLKLKTVSKLSYFLMAPLSLFWIINLLVFFKKPINVSFNVRKNCESSHGHIEIVV